MKSIGEVLTELYPNIQRIIDLDAKVSVQLKTPITYKVDGELHKINRMIKNNSRMMAEVEMSHDKLMRNVKELPTEVIRQIDHHLKLQG